MAWAGQRCCEMSRSFVLDGSSSCGPRAPSPSSRLRGIVAAASARHSPGSSCCAAKSVVPMELSRTVRPACPTPGWWKPRRSASERGSRCRRRTVLPCSGPMGSSTRMWMPAGARVRIWARIWASLCAQGPPSGSEHPERVPEALHAGRTYAGMWSNRSARTARHLENAEWRLWNRAVPTTTNAPRTRHLAMAT